MTDLTIHSWGTLSVTCLPVPLPGDVGSADRTVFQDTVKADALAIRDALFSALPNATYYRLARLLRTEVA
jgi:hypothetical protein